MLLSLGPELLQDRIMDLADPLHKIFVSMMLVVHNELAWFFFYLPQVRILRGPCLPARAHLWEVLSGTTFWPLMIISSVLGSGDIC